MRSRTNARSRVVGDGELNIFLNAEPDKVEDPQVGYIYAAKGSERDARDITLHAENGQARLTWKVSVGAHPDFSRAIHKVAFELLVKEKGRAYALHGQFAPTRDFVLKNTGHREVIMAQVAPQNDSVAQGIVFDLQAAEDEQLGDIVFFRIFQAGFWVDLTPDQRWASQIKAELKEKLGDSGWSYFPLEKRDREG